VLRPLRGSRQRYRGRELTAGGGWRLFLGAADSWQAHYRSPRDHLLTRNGPLIDSDNSDLNQTTHEKNGHGAPARFQGPCHRNPPSAQPAVRALGRCCTLAGLGGLIPRSRRSLYAGHRLAPSPPPPPPPPPSSSTSALGTIAYSCQARGAASLGRHCNR
jgi:hypothetical protein